MGVKLYRTNAAGIDYSYYRTAPSAPEQPRFSATESSGNYDKLTLHKTQYPSDAKSFAGLLAHEAAKETSVPASQARVDELRSQVEAGTYQPDANLIARRMLCY